MSDHSRNNARSRAGARRAGRSGGVSATEILQRAKGKEVATDTSSKPVTSRVKKNARGGTGSRNLVLDIALTSVCAVVSVAAIIMTFMLVSPMYGYILIGVLAATVAISIAATMLLAKDK